MTLFIDDGWLYITNGTDEMKIACKYVGWSKFYAPTMVHAEGGVNFGYDVLKEYFRFKAKNLIFSSEANYEKFMSTTKSWQQSGPFNLKLIVKSGGTFVAIDGTNDTFPVLIVGELGEFYKVAGDRELYICTKMTLEQAGDAS